ncbi:hypothetical protein HQ585_12270 [candidate division KSB1 bacterium]|nr:hypothetical protein [candidate division KSB1 bacterium]
MLKKQFFILLILAVGVLHLHAEDGIIPDPDPARFEEEINRFMQWDRKNSTPENAILFVGSSSIRMWQTHEGFPLLPIINRGFGGAHTSDVNHFYEQVIKKYTPSLIVLYVGDNDIAGGKSPDQVLEDYQILVKLIHEDNPSSKLIFIPIKPSQSRWKFWPKMEETNRLIQEFNELNPNLIYIDLATPLLNSAGIPDPSLYLEDELHLSKKGYKIWETILRPLLQELYEQ